MKESKKKKVKYIFIIFSLLLIVVAIFISSSEVKSNLSIYTTILIWLSNTLLTLGGGSLIYEKFIESQNKAVSGFYLSMQIKLEELGKFVHNDWQDSPVFWRLMKTEYAQQEGKDTVNSEILKQFKETALAFQDFLSASTDNVSPDNNIKKWYEHQKTLAKFLDFGAKCDMDTVRIYKDEKKISKYFEEVKDSMSYIAKSIDDKIEKHHDELNR